MLVFWKIWRVLFFRNTRFEIRPFSLLPTKFFDDELEVRCVFLEISKACDKVWYEGVIFRLRQDIIFGYLLNILRDFSSNRK